MSYVTEQLEFDNHRKYFLKMCIRLIKFGFIKREGIFLYLLCRAFLNVKNK